MVTKKNNILINLLFKFSKCLLKQLTFVLKFVNIAYTRQL
jgi:hypothetical protein